MNTEREKGREIPRIVESAITTLRTGGAFDTEGLFRISGMAREIDAFKDSVQRGA